MVFGAGAANVSGLCHGAHQQVGSFFVPHDLREPLTTSGTGPLAGLTAAVKDMYDIEGERTSGGSPHWVSGQKSARRNACVVQSLLDAGATIVGKTICDEFFYSLTGANAHYGTPVNTRAPGRLPGGSSAGSAAAVAAGACDLALGSDTGGSVRVPAALCGVYGIRPTLGRVSLSGAMAMAPSFDAAGWFTSGPGLLRLVGRVLLGEDRVDAIVGRVVVAEDAFAEADAEVAALLRSFLKRAGSALPSQTGQPIAPEGFDPWREAFRLIQAREIWRIYGRFIEREKPQLGPGTRERMDFASTVSKADGQTARRTHRKVREYLRRLLPPGTVLAVPTAPCIAPAINAPADLLESFRIRAMRLTCIGGLGGLPQVTVPVGVVAGCPVGLSFIGWAGSDETLLDLAVTLGRFCGLATVAAWPRAGG